MNTKEKIEVMQAWLDGKPIQHKPQHAEEWVDWSFDDVEPTWDWPYMNYRIKPEPERIDWSRMPKDVLCEVKLPLVRGRVKRYFNKKAPDGGLLFYSNGADSFSAGPADSMAYVNPKIIENPIRPWFGGDCPLPEGVRFRYWRRGIGLDAAESDTPFGLRWDWKDKPGDIIAYQILGVAEGWIE